MIVSIYIMHHERHEAAEAYADRLSPTQIEYLKDTDGEFQLQIDTEGRTQLLLIEDEG